MDDPMPTFVLKGKDLLAPTAIDAYRRACKSNGLTDQADQVKKAVDEMIDWQDRNLHLVKLPDHVHVPARDQG